jgi:hypothetical protein
MDADTTLRALEWAQRLELHGRSAVVHLEPRDCAEVAALLRALVGEVQRGR